MSPSTERSERLAEKQKQERSKAADKSKTVEKDKKTHKKDAVEASSTAP